MTALPTRRLLVYVATGAVVLLAGVLGLLSMRGSPDGDPALVIEAGGSVRSVSGGGPVAGPTGGDVGEGWVDGEGLSPTTTTETRRIWVQVAGAVVRPGVYHLAVGTRVFQAVLEAGGLTGDADEDAVAMAAELFDGCRVYVPKIGEMPAGSVVGPTTSSAGLTGGASGSPGPNGLVSLNTATAAELDTLPGIGPALAGQIVAHREAQGPFTSIDQLTDVSGIGPAKLEQLRPLVKL